MSKSPLAKLKAIDTGICIPLAPPCRLVTTSVDEVPDSYSHQDYSNLYHLRVELGCQFKANQAQYSEALLYAETNIRYMLYGDLIGEMPKLKHLIMSGDPSAAIKLVNEIESKARGETK